MDVRSATVGPMNVSEFFTFTETRPDEERWELIEGEPVLNETPVRLHQRILANLVVSITHWELESRGCEAYPGIAVLISDISALTPDFIVRPRNDPGGPICDDMIAAFEILSPSTASRDLGWKRKAYGSLPSVMHYAVVAQDRCEITCFDRATNFEPRHIAGADAALELAAIGVTLELADIYRYTGLSGG